MCWLPRQAMLLLVAGKTDVLTAAASPAGSGTHASGFYSGGLRVMVYLQKAVIEQ